MTKMNKSIISTALGALVLQTSVQASIEANLAFALTASYTEAALRERDEDGRVVRSGDMVYYNEWSTSQGATDSYNEEWGTKIVRERVSNREILEEIIIHGGVDSTIRGWSLKLSISGGDGEEVFMFATNGSQFVPVELEMDFYASAEQERYSYSYSYNENTGREVERERGNSTIMEETFVAMQIGEYTFDFATILNVSETIRSFGRGEDSFSVWMPRSIAMDTVVGSVESDDEDEDPAVLQGRIRASGAQLVD